MPMWTASIGISVLVAAGTLQPVVADASLDRLIVEPISALPQELASELKFDKRNVASVATSQENIFVTAMSRKEFTVLDPDSVVAGVGTEDMLPEAVLHVDSKAAASGLGVIRNGPITEGQQQDFLTTIFVREPTGTLLDFVETEEGFRCPARNYGIRARVTELRSDDPDTVTIFYQQYDAGGHVFIDEVGFVVVERNNFIRATPGAAELAENSLITFLCREYNDEALVYLGWPAGAPVFVIDEDWTLPVRIERITTIRTPSDSAVAVVASLKGMGPASKNIVDFDSGEPIESPFLYVGRAVSKNGAFNVLTSKLEKEVCSLVAVKGDRRPTLHCDVKDLGLPLSVIKKAGQARTAKVVAGIVSGLFAGATLLAALFSRSKKALLPLAISIASGAGAIGSKVAQTKSAKKALKEIPSPRETEFEHIVFIKADDFSAPTPEENERRKIKLLLTYAAEKKREEEEQERINNLRKIKQETRGGAKRGRG